MPNFNNAWKGAKRIEVFDDGVSITEVSAQIVKNKTVTEALLKRFLFLY